jgi:hypothetical protein
VDEDVNPIGMQVGFEIGDVGLVMEMVVFRIPTLEAASDTCIPEVPALISQPQAGVKVDVTRTLALSMK